MFLTILIKYLYFLIMFFPIILEFRIYGKYDILGFLIKILVKLIEL